VIFDSLKIHIVGTTASAQVGPGTSVHSGKMARDNNFSQCQIGPGTSVHSEKWHMITIFYSAETYFQSLFWHGQYDETIKLNHSLSAQVGPGTSMHSGKMAHDNNFLQWTFYYFHYRM
jgi:hypothetical protein